MKTCLSMDKSYIFKSKTALKMHLDFLFNIPYNSCTFFTVVTKCVKSLPEDVKEIYAHARPHLVSQQSKSQDGG